MINDININNIVINIQAAFAGHTAVGLLDVEYIYFGDDNPRKTMTLGEALPLYEQAVCYLVAGGCTLDEIEAVTNHLTEIGALDDEQTAKVKEAIAEYRLSPHQYWLVEAGNGLWHGFNSIVVDKREEDAMAALAAEDAAKAAAAA